MGAVSVHVEGDVKATRHTGPEGEPLAADGILLAHGVVPLTDECVTVAGGLVVCGVPWSGGSPDFGHAIRRVPGEGAVDILLVHGPPAGHGDQCVTLEG